MSMDLLQDVRLGVLTSKKANGDPLSVPIWFDWDGTKIQFFSGADSKKVKRLKNSPHASLLVTNNVGEPEGWIAFDGNVELLTDGAAKLAETLARRYWDMNIQKNINALNEWMAYPDAFVRYEMTPTKIRQGK